MRDRFGVTNPRAQQLRFHTQTAGSTLTAQQPDNNIVRVALQAMAAVLGARSRCTATVGRGSCAATEESARIALRTQQVVAYESGVVNTVDPVAGAWAIERLTDEIEQQAMALLEKIERLGGTLAAIETGAIQREIQDSAYRTQQAIDRGDQVVVGITASSMRHPLRSRCSRIDPEVERRQTDRVRAVRATRDQALVRDSPRGRRGGGA